MDHPPAATKTAAAAALNNNEDAARVADAGDGTYCSKHPYRTNLGGGICAFCLQEKLGKLVSSSSSSTSSSFPLPARPSKSSPHSDSSSPAASSPPSSDISFSCSSSKPPSLDPDRRRDVHALRGKILGFLYSKKKKKRNNKKCESLSSDTSDRAAELASFKRSNTAPRRPGHLGGFLDCEVLEYSPRRKGFWSFLYLSGSDSQPSSSAASSRHHNGGANSNAALSSSSSVIMAGGRRAERMTPFSDSSKRCADVIPEDDDLDCSNGDINNFERKVSRSRSVGCGSRSFSGDFFERISTGFGDCTLRRVESQREPNGHSHPLSKHRSSSADPDCCMKERVRCGGIFGGFTIASSSSSSSSSYWITSSSSEDHHHHHIHGSRPRHANSAEILHTRNRSWGWAFASPMRAFSRPSPRDGKGGGKRGNGNGTGTGSNATPNLNAVPSLLAVGG